MSGADSGRGNRALAALARLEAVGAEEEMLATRQYAARILRAGTKVLSLSLGTRPDDHRIAVSAASEYTRINS